MPNLDIDAPAAYPLGPCPGPSLSAYHPPIQTAHLYGGDFFTLRAIPEPSPMPEAHSP